jgi:hypothetical protein
MYMEWCRLFSVWKCFGLESWKFESPPTGYDSNRDWIIESNN